MSCDAYELPDWNVEEVGDRAGAKRLGGRYVARIEGPGTLTSLHRESSIRCLGIDDDVERTHAVGDAITVNGSGYFYNVPPGEYVVRLLPPERSPTPTLECELDPHGIGWAFGVPVEGERNRYRVRVEPGLNNFAVRAFCTLKLK